MASVINSKRKNDQIDVGLDLSSCFVVAMVRQKKAGNKSI